MFIMNGFDVCDFVMLFMGLFGFLFKFRDFNDVLKYVV